MANEVSTLNGLFKERYADKEKMLVPDHVKLYNAVEFNKSKKQGASYNEPVVLSLESGFTYGGTSGNAFSLNKAKELKMENATIQSSELVLRSVVSIGALNRSASGEQAISKALDLMIGNMLKSIYHRLEVQMFYGQSGISVVESVPSPTANGNAVPMKDAEWAAGIWNGTTGAEIEIFSADLATKRGTYKVDGYSLADKSVTLTEVDSSGVATGDLTDIDVDDVVYFKGAAAAGGTLNEFIGIHGISEEKTSLFGITNTNEPLFQGSIVDVGTDATTNAALLSQDKIEEGISAMVEKGLMEEEVKVYVNPKQWDDLLSEQTAKRRFDQSYKSEKAQSGSREIEFFGQNGTIKVVASTFVKEGYAYICSEKELKRIGSVEVTFNRPDGKDYFRHLEDVHGMEARCMADQALFTARPSSICQLRYIKAE